LPARTPDTPSSVLDFFPGAEITLVPRADFRSRAPENFSHVVQTWQANEFLKIALLAASTPTIPSDRNIVNASPKLSIPHAAMLLIYFHVRSTGDSQPHAHPLPGDN
jgi:hypothetical protein